MKIKQLILSGAMALASLALMPSVAAAAPGHGHSSYEGNRSHQAQQHRVYKRHNANKPHKVCRMDRHHNRVCRWVR